MKHGKKYQILSYFLLQYWFLILLNFFIFTPTHHCHTIHALTAPNLPGNIDDQQLYTLRNFHMKGKKVINRGDSVKSRSKTSLNSRRSRWRHSFLSLLDVMWCMWNILIKSTPQYWNKIGEDYYFQRGAPLRGVLASGGADQPQVNRIFIAVTFCQSPDQIKRESLYS